MKKDRRSLDNVRTNTNSTGLFKSPASVTEMEITNLVHQYKPI